MTADFTSTPQFLYHATSRANLDSILEHGILRSKYGEIHGEMEYKPPEEAVYLSTFEASSNLNTALFDRGEVIVLRIRAADLDVQKFYPDDAFFYKLDEDFCSEAEEFEDDPEGMREFVDEAAPDFCELFGLKVREGKKFLKAFCESDGSHEAYSKIALEMGGLRYLNRQGEAAYLGDVPASAIIDWEPHPDSEPTPVAKRRHGPG